MKLSKFFLPLLLSSTCIFSMGNESDVQFTLTERTKDPRHACLQKIHKTLDIHIRYLSVLRSLFQDPKVKQDVKMSLLKDIDSDIFEFVGNENGQIGLKDSIKSKIIHLGAYIMMYKHLNNMTKYMTEGNIEPSHFDQLYQQVQKECESSRREIIGDFNQMRNFIFQHFDKTPQIFLYAQENIFSNMICDALSKANYEYNGEYQKDIGYEYADAEFINDEEKIDLSHGGMYSIEELKDNFLDNHCTRDLKEITKRTHVIVQGEAQDHDTSTVTGMIHKYYNNVFYKREEKYEKYKHSLSKDHVLNEYMRVFDSIFPTDKPLLEKKEIQNFHVHIENAMQSAISWDEEIKKEEKITQQEESLKRQKENASSFLPPHLVKNKNVVQNTPKKKSRKKNSQNNNKKSVSTEMKTTETHTNSPSLKNPGKTPGIEFFPQIPPLMQNEEVIQETLHIPVLSFFIQQNYEPTLYEVYVRNGGVNREWKKKLYADHLELLKTRQEGKILDVKDEILNTAEVEILQNILFAPKSMYKKYSWNNIIDLFKKAGWDVDKEGKHLTPRKELYTLLGSHSVAIHPAHGKDANGPVPSHCMKYLKLAFKNSYGVTSLDNFKKEQRELNESSQN